jgi:CRP-like cAMP-binding protein
MINIKHAPDPDLLARFEPMDRLRPADLEEVASNSVIEDVPPGKLIFKPGLREEESLYLLEGEVALVSDNRVLAHVTAGSKSASVALAPESPRRLWGWARRKVRILCVETKRIEVLLAKRPSDATDSGPSEQPENESPSRDADTSQVQALAHTVASLEGELADAKSQLERHEAAQAQYSDRQSEVQALEQQLADMAAAREAAERERDELLTRLRALQQELDSSRAVVEGDSTPVRYRKPALEESRGPVVTAAWTDAADETIARTHINVRADYDAATVGLGESVPAMCVEIDDEGEQVSMAKPHVATPDLHGPMEVHRSPKMRGAAIILVLAAAAAGATLGVSAISTMKQGVTAYVRAVLPRGVGDVVPSEERRRSLSSEAEVFG